MWNLNEFEVFHDSENPEFSVRCFYDCRILTVWEEVLPFIKEAFYDCINIVDCEQLKEKICSGESQLFAFLYDDQVIGIVSSQFEISGDKKVLHVSGMAGDFSMTHSFISVIEGWALANSASYITAVCSKSRARLFSTKYGFDSSRVFIVKPI